MFATVLLLQATIACQPPAGPAAAEGALNALETGFSEPLERDGEDDAASGDGGPGRSTDSDLGNLGDVDDPFGVIGPAFQGIGFQSHSAACDPFDEAYGTCL